jgi:hypothetical protein
MRDTSLRASYCRHVNGEIHRMDVRYMVMRIPKAMFPLDKLSEQEQLQGGQFVFRGIEMPASAEAEESILKAA